MKLKVLICCLLFCTFLIAQEEKTEQWLRIGHPKIIFDFNTADSLKLIWYKKDITKRFPIKKEKDNLLILDKGIPFDTLSLISKEEHSMVLFHAERQDTILLLKTNTQANSKQLLETLASKDFQVKTKDGLSNMVLNPNHFIREVLKNRALCFLDSKIDFKLSSIGLIVQLTIIQDDKARKYDLLLQEQGENQMRGFDIETGELVEFNLVESAFIQKKAANDIARVVGTYLIFEDSIQLNHKLALDIGERTNKETVPVGYSGYQFKEDHSFILKDKHHNVDIVGTWEIYNLDGREVLTLKGKYKHDNNKHRNTYERSFYLEYLDNNNVLLIEPNCYFDHGFQQDEYRQFLKRL